MSRAQTDLELRPAVKTDAWFRDQGATVGVVRVREGLGYEPALPVIELHRELHS